jgi:hypothetical protein
MAVAAEVAANGPCKQCQDGMCLDIPNL